MFVALGDVSGHGVAAALVTTMAKAAFSLFGRRCADDPAEALRAVSSLLLQLLDRKRMMTCVIGVLHPERGEMCFANAGHCYPVVHRPSGETEMLQMSSFPMGLSRRPRIVSLTCPAAGNVFVLYSDGLVEAVDVEGTQLGYDRFLDLLGQAIRECPEKPGPRLFELVVEATGGVPLIDDASVLFIREQAGAAAGGDSGR